MIPTRPVALSLALLTGCLWSCLVGCSSYKLQGVVVSGQTPGVLVVDKDDPQLQQAGIDGAAVHLTIDPSEMRPKILEPRTTDSQGRFAAPVGAFGAGLLEYQVQVTCIASGFQSTQGLVALPSSGKRLLIVLAPGRDAFRPQEDLIQETLRWGGQASPPDPRHRRK